MTAAAGVVVLGGVVVVRWAENVRRILVDARFVASSALSAAGAEQRLLVLRLFLVVAEVMVLLSSKYDDCNSLSTIRFQAL